MIEGIKVAFSDEVIEKTCDNVRKVMKSGRLVHDEFIPKFEEILRNETGKKHVALFASDTSAQEILYKVLKPESNGIAYFQGNGFPSPIFAAKRAGYKIKYLDIDPLTLDVTRLEDVRKDGSIVNLMSTGGRIPLKLVGGEYGVFEKRKCISIDDAAHSFGSRRGTHRPGSLGDYTIFSFYATKPMTMGEGGAICSSDEEVVEKCAMYSRYGKVELFGQPVCKYKGYSCRMTELLAAVGCAVYEGIPESLRIRKKLAAIYLERLKDFAPIHLYDYGDSNFYKFPVFIDRKNMDAVKLKFLLREKGINLSAGVYDFPVYHQPAIYHRSLCLPGTELFCKQHVCLPMSDFHTESEIHQVCDVLLEILK